MTTIVLDLRQARPDRSQQLEEFVVDQQRRGARMFDRVDDLFVRETDVHGLQDRAHHRDGEKRLQEPMGVPIHHADSVAGSHAQFAQPARQTTDAVAQHADR